MDDQSIKRLILEILQEKMAPDILILSRRPEQVSRFQAGLEETCRELSLNLDGKKFGEDFLRPKRALYLTGFDLKESMDLLLASDPVYEKIRDLAGKISVFLEIVGLEVLEEGEGKEDFLRGLAKLLAAKGIELVFEKKKAGKAPKESVGSVQDLRGKKILTLRDVQHQGIRVLVMDQDARCTMALSDWLRDQKIEVRRMKCN